MELTQEVLSEKLKKFNGKRVLINLALVLFIVQNVVAFAVFAVFVPLFVVNVVKGDFNITFLACFCGAIALALLNNLSYLFKVIKLRRNWRKDFKHTFVPHIFSTIYEDAKYDPKHGISKRVVDASGITGSGSDYHSEDLIIGKYRGVNFARADVQIRIAPKNGSAIANVFVGQWMIFDFNKPIDAYVRVYERALIRGMNPLAIVLKAYGLNKVVGASKGRVANVEKIAVEDVAFNKKFEVVTQNPHTAFYILTPQFIEAVKYLESQVSGQLIFAFCDNMLHVAVNTNSDHFEAMLSKSASENYEIIKSQVLKTTKFIDILRLDNDYFKQ